MVWRIAGSSAGLTVVTARSLRGGPVGGARSGPILAAQASAMQPTPSRRVRPARLRPPARDTRGHGIAVRDPAARDDGAARPADQELSHDDPPDDASGARRATGDRADAIGARPRCRATGLPRGGPVAPQPGP